MALGSEESDKTYVKKETQSGGRLLIYGVTFQHAIFQAMLGDDRFNSALTFVLFHLIYLVSSDTHMQPWLPAFGKPKTEEQ